MKLLSVGNFSKGEQPGYRANAFRSIDGIDLQIVDLVTDIGSRIPALFQSIAWRLGRPFDIHQLNPRLGEAIDSFEPDVLLCESAVLLKAETLRKAKAKGARIVGSSQDYVTARHNTNRWQNAAFPYFDLFFTTKTFGVRELEATGVGRVELVNNTFEPEVHRPLSPEAVGDEYEAFDCVFVGTFERDRAQSLRKLADAGMSVLIQGNAAGRLAGGWEALDHPLITRRPAARQIEYTKALHRGKVALCFLRKLNRDQITCRSIEIPAMARPMLAEKTAEHDAQFVDGEEYVGFTSDAEMVAAARRLVDDARLRHSIGTAGRQRCLDDELDNASLVRRMLDVMRDEFPDLA